MTPGRIRVQVALERVARIRSMLDALRRLPASDLAAFLEDERTAAAAESYLRRAIEGLLDLGRHILAKGFGEGVVEYKEIAAGLADRGIVPSDHRAALLAMAGYRNRLTHSSSRSLPPGVVGRSSLRRVSGFTHASFLGQPICR
jgi:uncharacterized protein YutE (UPF0331/DUF86 family)